MNFSRTELYTTVKILNLCAQARTEDDVFGVIDQIRALVPYEAAMAVALQPGAGLKPKVDIINHSYSAQWLDIYQKEGYVVIDPVIHRARSSNVPFYWSEVYASAGDQGRCRKSQELEDFLNELGRYNLLEGIAGGWRGCSFRDVQVVVFLCLNRVIECRYLEFLKQLLPLLRIAVQQCLMARKYTGQRESLLRVLTTREREVLKWACVGKTSWEIGRILCIKERTVKFHLNNTFNKLEVVNRPQAVAKAVDLGLI